MTTLMKKAVERLTALPEEEQDRYAREILDLLEGEEKWDALFADPRSATLLARMAAQAREEHKAGKTRPLDELLDDVEE